MPKASRRKRSKPTFPRNATQPDKHGYPHYEAIGTLNKRFEASYGRELKKRRGERQAYLKECLTRGSYGRRKWSRRIDVVRESLAESLGLIRKKANEGSMRASFDRAVPYSLLGPNEAQYPWTPRLRFMYYHVTSENRAATPIETLLIRPHGKPPYPKAPIVLWIPDAGPGLIGAQSPESASKDGGILLASAGCTVAIPRLHVQERFSSTYNKGRLLAGHCALGDVVGQAARILDALFGIEDLQDRNVFVAGRGFGGLCALFLAAGDARVGGAWVESPTSISGGEVPEALIVPGLNRTTDLTEISTLIAPRPLALLDAQEGLDAPAANVRTLARAAEKAWELTGENENIKSFNGKQKAKAVDWICKTAKCIETARKARNAIGLAATHYPMQAFRVTQYSSLQKWKAARERFREGYAFQTGLPEKRCIINVRRKSRVELDDCVRDEYHVRTGPFSMSNLVFMRPYDCKGPQTTIIHLPGSSSDVGRVENMYAHEIIEQGWNAVIIDARVALYPFHPHIFEDRAIITQSLHDLLCCLDWVVDRKEVDEERIGVMGLSQGGTHSWMVAAMDERIAAAASICGVTSYRSLIAHTSPMHADGPRLSYLDHHSIYYFTPGVLELGDQGDLCSLIAPRPFLFIGANRDDCFPLSGMRQSAREIRHVYKLYEAADRFKYVEFEGPHSMPQHTRETTYAFFRKHLG